MTQTPFLRNHPFERLQVTDGLLINAERWQRAHAYHRERQNAIYQALNQPGIVWGLGVCPIPAPADIPAQFRDQRWVQIQPGMAIDRMGNPIIVPEPIEFRITSVPEAGQSATIYLVISYVDPDHLQRTTQNEFVRETFRLDEKGTLPDHLDVELCRVVLQAPVDRLMAPTDVFAPGPNSIDLRYRVPVRSRAATEVKLGCLSSSPQGTDDSAVVALQHLLSAAPTLHPALAGTVQSLPMSALAEPLDRFDLIYLTVSQLGSVLEPTLDLLGQYVAQGGTLLIAAPTKGTTVAQLWPLQEQIRAALDRLQAVLPSTGGAGELATMRQELTTELNGLQTDLDREMLRLTGFAQTYARRLGIGLERFDRLPQSHPLRSKPFLFATLPTTQQHPLQLFAGNGLTVMVGDIADLWGLEGTPPLSRTLIRELQEWGMNLLQVASQRRQLVQLMRSEVTERL